MRFFRGLGFEAGGVCETAPPALQFALLAMALNHVLKILIKNPRPFLMADTHLENWAVSADRACQLVTEYSTRTDS
jgi:hypothetical protein